MDKFKILMKRFSLFILIAMLVPLNKVLAAAKLEESEPHRLRSLENMFANAMIVVWALTIPYFIFIIFSIGFQWIFAFGDEQKLQELKSRGGRVIASFALMFGGYIVISTIMKLFLFQDPNKCFDSPLGKQVPFFKFFFPEVCEG